MPFATIVPTPSASEQAGQYEAHHHEEDRQAGGRGASQAPAKRRLVGGHFRRRHQRCSCVIVTHRLDPMSGRDSQVMTCRHDEVMHAHEAHSEKRDHREARKQRRRRTHDGIITRTLSQRAPRPFSRL